MRSTLSWMWPVHNTDVDQRRAARYPLALMVAFSWKEGRGEWLTAHGVTRDISTQGVFVYAPMCPPPEAKVKMQIRLPTLGGEARSLSLDARGRVLRVEERPDLERGSNGFAALVETKIMRARGEAREEGYSESEFLQ